MSKLLAEMAKEAGSEIVVGLDAHLFTKQQVDVLEKVEGVKLALNTEAIPSVVSSTQIDSSSNEAQETLTFIDHDVKYSGLTREMKFAKVFQ